MHRKRHRPRWETSYPNKVLQSNDAAKIRSYIIDSVSRSKKSTKPFSFYIFLSKLDKDYEKTVINLIKTLPDWGCWKEMFVLLLATKSTCNSDLEEFIYEVIKGQILKDSKERSRNRISRLAKWIPREKSSFDKKLDFVTNICKLLYPDLEPRTARRRYRKQISDLNKKLDTTEIKLCSKNLAEIDFAKVPAKCFNNNMKTFLNDPDCKQNLQKFYFKKYLDYSIEELLNIVLFKQGDQFQQNLVNEVWKINKFQFKDMIYQRYKLNISSKNLIVVLDFSKKMYDNRMTGVPIGFALLAADYRHPNPGVVINSHIPTFLNLDKKLNMFQKIEQLSMETGMCHNTIDVDKIITLTPHFEECTKILVVTDDPNKPLINSQNKIKTEDIVIHTVEYIKKENKIRDKNKKIVIETLDSSDELKTNNSVLYGALIMLATIIFGSFTYLQTKQLFY